MMPPRKRNRGTGHRPNTDEQMRMVTIAAQARRDGATWQRAAEAAGYTDRSSCHRAVMKFLRENAVETVVEYRELLKLRYERMLLTVMPMAIGRAASGETPAVPPDLDAMAEARRLSDSLARLTGSIMPTKVEVTTELDEEIKRLAAALAVEDTDITSMEVGEEV